ncbi:MAG: hypothetical protein JST87_13240 [Bacteroidetes bacterium]|nr:hypothetical protein [Bacteroidota bacterium]
MKNEFIEIAVANLQKNARIHAKWKKHISREIDGRLEIQVGNKIILLNAIIRDEVDEDGLNEIYKLAVKYVQFVLITKSIPPKIKDFLQQVHLAYLEENGNFFLEQKNIFILVEKSEAGMLQEAVIKSVASKRR